MSYKFNPFTGGLDYYEKSLGGSGDWQKTYVIADSIFVINRTVNLQGIPLNNTDFVHINGLLIKDDCYTISGSQLIFDAALPLKVGMFIDIRYSI